MGPNEYAGGPVTGGKTYTVNEIGTEGFMSASGKLSEIKAPAWGQWKAPSSGTVIPAHIWKSIKAGNQDKASIPRITNPGNAVARAISTINNTAGDSIQNTVTIQSANPTQTANNMLVQLQKSAPHALGGDRNPSESQKHAMFNFGSSEDTASLYWNESLNVQGPALPDVHFEEMEEQDLIHAFAYLYIALREAYTGGAADEVIELLTEPYDEVFELLCAVSQSS